MRTKSERVRSIAWVDDNACCTWCGKTPYRRSDGRSYFYRYTLVVGTRTGNDGPDVCSLRCDGKLREALQ